MLQENAHHKTQISLSVNLAIMVCLANTPSASRLVSETLRCVRLQYCHKVVQPKTRSAFAEWTRPYRLPGLHWISALQNKSPARFELDHLLLEIDMPLQCLTRRSIHCIYACLGQMTWCDSPSPAGMHTTSTSLARMICLTGCTALASEAAAQGRGKICFVKAQGPAGTSTHAFETHFVAVHKKRHH